MKEAVAVKERFIANLLAQVYNYLHGEKGYSSWLDIIDQQLIKFPCKRLNGPFGMHISDSGVEQATQFRDFLLNYPQENTVDDLAQAVSSLYVSNREFPFGFGNTKQLRQRISFAFPSYYIHKNERIKEISDTKYVKILDQRIKIMGAPVRAFLNHYYEKKIITLAALTSNLLPELQKIIMQLWQALHFPSHNNCKPGESFHCLGLFKAPRIEHRTVMDEQDPANEFVLMTQM